MPPEHHASLPSTLFGVGLAWAAALPLLAGLPASHLSPDPPACVLTTQSFLLGPLSFALLVLLLPLAESWAPSFLFSPPCSKLSPRAFSSPVPGNSIQM